MLTTSVFGKHSVEDLWDNLFQIEGVDAFGETSVRGQTGGQHTRLLHRGQVHSEQTITNRGVEGTSMAHREKLAALAGAQKLGRRVASINIPGIISKFGGSAPRAGAQLGTSGPGNSQLPEQKNRLEKEDNLPVPVDRITTKDKDQEEDPLNNKASSSSLENKIMRRYCIVDNFLYNSTRPLPEKLETLLDLFKETIFTCETDFQEKMNLEAMKSKIFSSFGFIGSKGFDKKGYLNTCQSVIEMLISHFRGLDISRSLNKRSVVLNHHILKSDLVFLAIRKIVSLETTLILFELYFKILLSLGSLDKAEALAKLCLSIAYIGSLSRFKIESYNMLGQVFEKRRQPEIALLCFTRSMQFCIEAQDKVRESYMCDKIGLQLYYLNEMELAKHYHVRFLMSFHEPDLTNAVLRSREILQVEEKQFSEYYLLRHSNPIDKYRAVDMLLNLKVSPFDEFLGLEKDEKGSPTILNFIELMLTIQKRETESLKLKKISIIQDSIFGKKNREFERNLKEKEGSKPVTFTAAGMQMLVECNEYIPKISASLLGMNLKTGLRITHQKDFNSVFNYINQSTCNPQDFETVKTKAGEISRKNSVEDMLMFLTRARYFVMRKLNEVSNIKASRYHRMLRPSMKPPLGSKSSLLQK
jgi:hypothetical protein